MHNYFKILGVHRESTAAEIKAAYRHLAYKAHPDMGGDPDKFTLLNTAYKTLTDTYRAVEYAKDLKHLDDCALCKGRGYSAKQVSLTRRELTACRKCGGSGKVL